MPSAIAALLYEEADPEQLTTTAGIEKTVRDQLKRACHAPYWFFFIRTATGIESGRLRENLYKVGGSLKRLHQAEAFLWRGQVDAALELFLNCDLKQGHKFCFVFNQASPQDCQL